MDKLLELRDIAVMEEGRQAQAIADVARESRPLGGGIMSRGDPGTWVNTAVGVGLAGPVTESDIDRLIGWYEEAGLEPRLETCPFVDPSLRAILESRGFIVRIFENTFFRTLVRGEAIPPTHPVPSSVEIREVSRNDPARIREYGVTVASGFAEDGVPRDADVELMARCVLHERSTMFGAYLDGKCIGGGGLELLDETSALFGLSVLAPFRRRGVQQALIAARLNVAAARGARIATISSRPGVATERNVRRMGFQVAYTKVALVRPRLGLAPVIEQ